MQFYGMHHTQKCFTKLYEHNTFNVHLFAYPSTQIPTQRENRPFARFFFFLTALFNIRIKMRLHRLLDVQSLNFVVL